MKTCAVVDIVAIIFYLLIVLISIAIPVGVFYMAFHFAAKYW